MCEDYIKSREGVDKISDIPFGGGYKMVRDEFQKTFLELSKLKYSIVFLTHSKTRTTNVLDEHGEPIEQVCPNLNNAAAEAVNGLVDIIAYISVEYDKDFNATRWLYLRQTPYIFAGSRYSAIKPKIPLGYHELVDAVTEAMEKEAERTNTAFVSEAEKDNMDAKPVIAARPFSEIMDEAKELWMQYMDQATSDEDADYRLKVLNDIVTRIFGKQIKLSTAIPAQSDLVELVIDSIKEIL